MRLVMKLLFPPASVPRGSIEAVLPRAIMAFVTRTKPEACYFGPQDGMRAAMFFFDVPDAALVPSVSMAEAYFGQLEGRVEITPLTYLDVVR